MTRCRMRSRSQGGFTLIELMIVVVLIGIVAAVGIYYLGGKTSKAKASEVYAVFAEIRNRQQQYHNEFNSFHSTTTDDTSLHPSPITSSQRSVAPMPKEWLDLRINLPKKSLYCAYGTVAGPANGGSIGSNASAFGFSALARDWFYIVAECDFDGNSSKNAKFFTHSGIQHVLKENETN